MSFSGLGTFAQCPSFAPPKIQAPSKFEWSNHTLFDAQSKEMFQLFSTNFDSSTEGNNTIPKLMENNNL